MANRDKWGPGESPWHVPKVTKDSLVCQGEKGSLNKVAILGFPAPKAHPCVYFHILSMQSTQGPFWSPELHFPWWSWKPSSQGVSGGPLGPVPHLCHLFSHREQKSSGPLRLSAAVISPLLIKKRKMNLPYRSQKVYFQLSLLHYIYKDAQQGV